MISRDSNSATAALFVLIALRRSRVPAKSVNAQLGLKVITRGAPQAAAALLSKVPVSLLLVWFLSHLAFNIPAS